jgi:hypothetical protein
VLAAVIAAVTGVAALALLVTGVLFLAWSWHGGPGPAAAPAPKEKETRPPPPEPFAAIREGVRDHKYKVTRVAGGAFAPIHFEDVPPEGAVLIGFEVGLGSFVGNADIIDYLRPIYLTAEGEKLGTAYGRPTARTFTVKAKPGYAVGGMTIHGGGLLDGFAITFMKLDKKGLTRDGAYQSAWIGGPGGGEEVAGGDGSFVVGICGRKMDEREGHKPGGLGLVLLKPE